MKQFDESVKSLFSQEIAQATLSSRRKAEIKEVMCQELEQSRKKRLRRAWAKAGLFWESTHEVSLAPLAAAACILLILTGAGLWQALSAPDGQEQSRQVYFISQADGGMEIVPLRDGREDYRNDNTP